MGAMKLLAACACLVAGGCAMAQPRAEGPPAGLLVAFADGFHSGVILERSQAPAELLPPDAPAEARWAVFHFGETRWMTGDAAGACAAVGLALTSGPGGLQVDLVEGWVHRRGGTDPATLRLWFAAIDQQALDGIRARLRSWASAGPSRPLRPGSLWWPSPQRWRLSANCHDFTADALAGAGIAAWLPPIAWAAPLRSALDRAWPDPRP